MIPTLTSDGFLHKVNRHRQRFLTELERRKAFRYCIAVFTCIAIIVMAYIVRPVPFGGKPSQNQITTQRDR